MRVTIAPLAAAARSQWVVLARGHQTFYYWLTQDNNATARVLSAKVAKFNGFLRYDSPIG